MTIQAQFTEILETLSGIANQYFYDGRLDDAVRLLAQGVDTAAGFSDVAQEARFNLLLSYGSMLSQDAWLSSGDYDVANQVVEELEGMIETDAQKGQWLNLKGNILRQQALSATDPDFMTPRKLFEESIFLIDKDSMPQVYFWSIFRMGLCDQFMKEYDSALAFFREAESIARDHDFKAEVSYATRHIGFVHQFTGQYEAALTAFQESLEIRKVIGFRLFLSLSHLAVAGALEALKRNDEALTEYHDAVIAADAIGIARTRMITRINYAKALFDSGDIETAKPYLLESKTLGEELHHAGVLNLANELLLKISELS